MCVHTVRQNSINLKHSYIINGLKRRKVLKTTARKVFSYHLAK